MQQVNTRFPVKEKNGTLQSAMTLGTVQLGLPYGAANKTGQPSEGEAIEIVRQAVLNGITHIDCARAYGDAEARVGQALQGFAAETVTVITKLDPLGSFAQDASAKTVRSAVIESLNQSKANLQKSQLDVLMLHRWSHRKDFKGLVWETLLETKSIGEICSLGASVQSPEEALEAIADPEITYLQLPFNLLDWRWKAAGVDRAASERSDLIVHARSALLQGILAAPAQFWPEMEEMPDGQPQAWLKTLARLAEELNRKSVTDLCFAFVRGQPWIDSVVVGLETRDQLVENMDLFREPALTPSQIEGVEEVMHGAPKRLLDPALWKA